MSEPAVSCGESRWIGAVAVALLGLSGCAEAGVGCDSEAAGPSGGALDATLTVCVRDADGATVSSAVVRSGAEQVSTDETGRAVLSADGSADFELVQDRTLAFFGVTSERFTVVVPTEAPLSDLEGTVSGLAALPPPAASDRRLVLLSSSVPIEPAPLARALMDGVTVACEEPVGDTCALSLRSVATPRHVGATVVDEDRVTAERTVVAFGFVEVEDVARVNVILSSEALPLEVDLTGVGVDAVVGVPGLGLDGYALLFGSGSSLGTIGVPSSSTGRPWISVVYEAGDRLRAGVVQRPSESEPAPVAPRPVVSDGVLTLGSSAAATVAVLEGGVERWRGTVLDGREEVTLPEGVGDRLHALLHGDGFQVSPRGRIEQVAGVASLPLR